MIKTGITSVTTQITPVLAASITTKSVSAATSSSASSGGTISSDGGGIVTSRGVCWNTAANPTIANSKTTDGSGIGTFTSLITGLSPNTTYYVRACATNLAGTTYGQQEVCVTSYGTVTEMDGNVYQTVKIGTQIWTRENLKTTKYKDGTAIPLATDNTAWSNLTTPGYCWYNNDASANKNVYGGLYNWYTVSTNNLCPSGWHVSTDLDWTTISNYLGGGFDAAVKLKETGTDHWSAPNAGVTNETGFTARPGVNAIQLILEFREKVIGGVLIGKMI